MSLTGRVLEENLKIEKVGIASKFTPAAVKQRPIMMMMMMMIMAISFVDDSICFMKHK